MVERTAMAALQHARKPCGLFEAMHFLNNYNKHMNHLEKSLIRYITKQASSLQVLNEYLYVGDCNPRPAYRVHHINDLNRQLI